jgi:dTDP-4-amino-4,6-dideoxygalactose transaminase
MWRIPLFDLDYGEEEESAVLRVLRSKWLTMGEVTQRFEGAFAEEIGVRHAVAVANGTVALHLACVATGIGPGDEVIVPALTFVATAAAVRYAGGVPVFADICSRRPHDRASLDNR